MATKGKSPIRAGNRSFAQDKKRHPAERRAGRVPEPTLCERCGAAFRNRAWRRASDVKPTHLLLTTAAWATCPACAQQKSDEYLGRIRVEGDGLADETALRRRIRNVAARAEFTQPERRVVSIERSRDGLEVLTTSQKLAHRIVHELKKAFGGRAVYRWSDDGMLEARWRGRAPAPAKG